MNMMIRRRYTTAQTAPIVSGISFLCTLLMSFPFNPAFMKVGPSQRIMAYAAAKAIPLNASDAMRGSPSPWKVFAIIPKQARPKDSRLRVSVEERWEGIDIVFGSCRCEHCANVTS